MARAGRGVSTTTLASLLIILVLVASLAYVIVFRSASVQSTVTTTSSRTTTLTTTATIALKSKPTGSCEPGPWPGVLKAATLPNGTVVHQVNFPVFTMRPNSTADFCVTYYDILNGPGKQSGVSGQPLVWGPNTTYFGNASNLTIAAHPGSAYFAPRQNTSVVYEVAASSNATGFYGLYLSQYTNPITTCAPVPIAVGQDPSQLSLNDFPGLFADRSCFSIEMSSRITGFGGGSVVYFHAPCGLPPTIQLSNYTTRSEP